MGRPSTGSVSERAPGQWRVQLTLNKRRWSRDVPPPPNGAPITRAYALRVRDTLLDQWNRGLWNPWAEEEATPKGPHTVESYLRAWALKLDNNSADEDRALVERYVAGSAFGAILLSELRPKHVAARLAWRESTVALATITLSPVVAAVRAEAAEDREARRLLAGKVWAER